MQGKNNTINNHTAAFMSLFFASLNTQIAKIKSITQTIMGIISNINQRPPNNAKGSKGSVNNIFFSLSFVFYYKFFKFVVINIAIVLFKDVYFPAITHY